MSLKCPTLLAAMFLCTMAEQGYQIGSCAVKMPNGGFKPACQATLKVEDGKWFRLIKSVHLSSLKTISAFTRVAVTIAALNATPGSSPRTIMAPGFQLTNWLR